MENLKRIIKILYSLLLVVLLWLSVGCSSTPVMIEREVKVPYEVQIKDTITLKDTVINYEPVWTGEVVDSLNNVIGTLKVYYKRKLAELSISKKDTVTKIDTFFVEQPIGDFLDKTSSEFSLTDKIILYALAGLAVISIMMLRRKKKLVNSNQ
jgi:hypothetical protein